MLSLRLASRRTASLKLMSLAVQAVTRLVGAFATVKILTVFLVPAQFIVYGQMQTLMQVYSAFTTSIASTKLSALIAKKGSEREKNSVVDTAIFLILGLASVLFLVTVLFRGSIQEYIAVEGRSLEVLILPLGAFAVAYSALIQAYFTGLGDIYRFSKNSVVAIALVTASTIALTAKFGYDGAVLSVGVSPIVAGLVIAVIDNPLKKPRVGNIRLDSGLELTGFTMSSILTLIGYYFAQLYIRSNYSHEVSAHEAGLLTAATRISDVYMGVLAVLYANVLTKIYANTGHDTRLSRISKSYLVFVAVGLPIFAALALSAQFWVPLVLSRQYVEAKGHMQMQICGDMLKCLYWISLYYVIAKCSSLTYFFIEIGGLLIYVVAAVYNPFGSHRFSPQLAQMLEYSILLVAVNVIVICKKND